jgi:ferredoxin-NADP reductase
MSMLRTIHDRQLDIPVTLFYGCRTREDIIFFRELDALRRRLASFRLILTLSRPDPEWSGLVGRLGPALLASHLPELALSRYFLCGPGEFTHTISTWLSEKNVPAERIHTEQFGKSTRRMSPGAIPALQSSAQPVTIAG